MRTRTITLFTAAALLAVGAATVPAAAQAPYGRIVVFGTSLSDPGNAFELWGVTNTPPDYLLDPLLVPSAPYARGGQHFSNGATWVEQFARSIGLAGSVRPAFVGSNSMATNYAVGAARARDDGINANLPAQVDAFLHQYGGVAPPDGLYVIEMGGNDVRDAFVEFANGRDGGAILQDALVSIATSIQTLHAAGARRFLVWRTPNVGVTPALRTLDQLNPGAAAFATLVTQSFNAGLDGVVAQLTALPGIDFARLDAFELINNLVARPGDFGLTNVTSACLTPAIAPFTCDRPDEFLFWDGIHPTKAVHTITAQEAARALGH
ncbi:MAG TPA: SGNH/GDSL hydrolase family protein [Vicinamibacterales bacterium]|nr:SGNH/GDSL hydrolase family protein [Vicinamibacterales bacterium]